MSNERRWTKVPHQHYNAKQYIFNGVSQVVKIQLFLMKRLKQGLKSIHLDKQDMDRNFFGFKNFNFRQ